LRRINTAEEEDAQEGGERNKTRRINKKTKYKQES
jgi:hypothetical protein